MTIFSNKVGYFILFLSFIISVSSQQVVQDLKNDKCQKKIYNTLQTKCQITMNACNLSERDKFQACKIKRCMRHLGPVNCERQMEFNLNQQDCYFECCKSSQFNYQKCQHYNKTVKELRQTQDNIMLLIILILTGILIIFTIFFFYKVIKCKQNKLVQQKIGHGINWIFHNYFDAKCDICLTYGSMIFTPCNHSYHETCYFENIKQTIKCPKCPQKIINTLKVSCTQCRQKYFKTKVENVQTFKVILNESKIQHIDNCQKTQKEMLTDLRLTNSGSSD